MAKGNLPFRCVSIAAHVLCLRGKRASVLLLKRRGSPLHGSWQMVAGKIERGETAAQAAWREVAEETGLTPTALYSADTLELYYNIERDCIECSPAFVAFVPARAKVRLSHEHSAHQWVTVRSALKRLVFSEQRRILRHIEANFVRKKPPECLKLFI